MLVCLLRLTLHLFLFLFCHVAQVDSICGLLFFFLKLSSSAHNDNFAVRSHKNLKPNLESRKPYHTPGKKQNKSCVRSHINKEWQTLDNVLIEHRAAEIWAELTSTLATFAQVEVDDEEVDEVRRR